mmetsp:Transcript_23696/g.33122  ORF Transcript_23696/g.33122 Transcript_23696/m.33122 type:complete len:103 (+) Transcript_23696:305-613(+)
MNRKIFEKATGTARCARAIISPAETNATNATHRESPLAISKWETGYARCVQLTTTGAKGAAFNVIAGNPFLRGATECDLEIGCARDAGHTILRTKSTASIVQ